MIERHVDVLLTALFSHAQIWSWGDFFNSDRYLLNRVSVVSKAQISDLNIHKCWRLNAHASLPTVVHTWTSPFSLLLMQHYYPLRRQKSISHNLTTSRGMKDRRLLASKFFLGVVKLWVCVVLSKRYLNSYEDYGFLGLSLSDTKIGGNGTLLRIFTHCVLKCEKFIFAFIFSKFGPSLKGHPVCEPSVKFSTRWPALWSENRVALNPY